MKDFMFQSSDGDLFTTKAKSQDDGKRKAVAHFKRITRSSNISVTLVDDAKEHLPPSESIKILQRIKGRL